MSSSLQTSHNTHKITFRLEVRWNLIRSGLSYKKTPNSTFHAESLFSWSIRFCFESFLSSFCSDDDTLDDVSLFVGLLVGITITTQIFKSGYYSSPSFLATIILFRWAPSIIPPSILNSPKASSISEPLNFSPQVMRECRNLEQEDLELRYKELPDNKAEIENLEMHQIFLFYSLISGFLNFKQFSFFLLLYNMDTFIYFLSEICSFNNLVVREKVMELKIDFVLSSI